MAFRNLLSARPLSACLLLLVVCQEGALGALGAPAIRRMSDVAAFLLHVDTTLTVDEAVKWIDDHHPKTDNTTREFRLAHATQAVETRNNYRYAADVPLNMYEDYVLPYTTFDEQPEAWRTQFAKILAPFLNKDMSAKEAATSIQENIWTAFGEPPISFKSNQTPQVLSPSDVLSKRYGSCTGLSIFLVDAFRSCGLPARVVGTAEWNRPEGGNHNWPEVWFDNQWNFIDPGPGNATWNEAWFVEIASKAVARTKNGIYAAMTWLPDQADSTYIGEWRTPSIYFPALEVTSHYAEAGRFPLNNWGVHTHQVPLAAIPVLLMVAGAAGFFLYPLLKRPELAAPECHRP